MESGVCRRLDGDDDDERAHGLGGGFYLGLFPLFSLFFFARRVLGYGIGVMKPYGSYHVQKAICYGIWGKLPVLVGR